MNDQAEQVGNNLLNEPPEGVLAGESVPRENEVEEEKIYEKMKRERIQELQKNHGLDDDIDPEEVIE